MHIVSNMRSFNSLIRHSRRRGRPPNGIVRYAWDSEYDDPCKAKRAILCQQTTSMTSIRNGESSTLLKRQDSSQVQGRIRSIHSTGMRPKPPSYSMTNGRIHSMETTLPGADHSHTYIPDGSQILTEWRLLERRLLEIDRKGKSKEIDNSYDSSDLLPHSNITLDPRFFTENEKPSQRITQDNASLEDSLLLDEADHTGRKLAYKSLWSASVDQHTIRACIQSAVDKVRKGVNDFDVLAKEMLQSIEVTEEGKPEMFSVPDCARLEELRMLLLSAWISIASQKIDLAHSQNVPVYLFTTQDMYLSTVSVAEVGRGFDQEYTRSIMAVQRATLFRLFRLMLHFSRSNLPLNSKIRIDAILLCSKVTCDPRLKPAQARYMTRKILGWLRAWVNKGDDCISSTRLWLGLRNMLFDLMDRRVIQSCLLQEDELARTDMEDEIANPITDFLLCCSKTIGNKLGPDALAQHTLSSMAQRAGKSGSDGKMSFASRPKEVEIMIAELMRGNEVRTAFQLYSLATTELRSIDALCRLMRHYGNSPLCFSASSSDFQDSKRVSGRTSRALMLEMVSRLSQLKGAGYKDCLKSLAHARFAYCADRGLAGRAMNDLRSFVGLMGAKSQTETLIELGEPAYCHFVRSLALGGRWSNAKEYASRLSKYQTQSGVFLLNENNRVNLLNVLLSSYLWPSKKSKENDRITTSPNASDQIGDKSRLHKTWNGISIIKNFCEEQNILPDRKSVECLITFLRQCNHKLISGKGLNQLASIREKDWKEEGVAGVLKRVEAILHAAGEGSDMEREE